MKADIQTNVADCLAVIQAPTTEQRVMRYELSDFEWSVMADAPEQATRHSRGG
jgi:hypothetical protein